MRDKKSETNREVSRLESVDKARYRKAIEKGWSRRDVLQLVMASGFTAAAAHQIFSDQQTAIAATPRKGGTIRASLNAHGPDDTLDPARYASGLDYTRGRIMYNSLTQLDESLSPQPELAESFEANSNATEWTFKIRKGVEFHDGSKLTADDIIYTMNRHLGEDSVSVFKSMLTPVTEWKKMGTHEVKAVLSTPNSDLPTILALFQAKVVKNGTKGGGIGTGPFTTESFQPGVRSVHKRNENYWREPAHLDAIEANAITDPVARVNAVVAGDIDIAGTVDPNSFRQIEESDSARLVSIPAGQQTGICCLRDTAPGNNIDFVRGLQYIQDRERIVKRVLKGRGTVGNDHPISPAHGQDYCHELPQRTYDPDKAKFHFKKAGVSSAEVFVAPIAVGIEELTLMAQANCSKIGFDLRIKKVPADGYWGAVWMKEPLNAVNWFMRPTANAQINIQFAPNGPWNDTHWHNDRMGELLKLSLAELDLVKRHAMYCEMQTLIHEGSGMVIPCFVNVNDGVRNDVMGIPKVPIGPIGGCEWPEFAWKA
ncbi:MAG: ABC transporter substrate-binding protein [Gammaproteobacteria bacterium]|nr:MAG: ABC transporter substrate-binding protein [Gammaproteobacteria bacterium]